MSAFAPWKPLVEGRAPAACRAVVILPARNEEDSLPAALDALAAQGDLHGKPLERASFELLLLLNNCTDNSAEVARAWKAAHPEVTLHVVERALEPEDAHVGTARRWLMDTAWARLRDHAACTGILSTDSDTVVAPDWIAQNLRALEGGADAVGGVIELKPGELQALPAGALAAYTHDRDYQRLCAELEDRMDPQAGDPWPRHLEHFGASLACTPAAYARVGGLPPVNPLEDMAFVEALYRADARLRHEPAVRVRTSARFDGRATIGLSWQLRRWQAMFENAEPHVVPNAASIQHRFRCLRALRALHRAGPEADLRRFAPQWQERIRAALADDSTTGEFLARIDSDAWIAETYPKRTGESEITGVNRALRAAIRRERAAEAGLSTPASQASLMPAGARADQAGTALCDAR